jgi:hypothetical protein
MSFDTQLKERLDSAAESMPGEPLDLMTTLTAARRSRRKYRMVAGIATAAVLLTGGITAAVTLGGREPRKEQDVISPGPRVSQAEAFDAASDFLAAINLPGGQKTRAMWDLLSPVSQSYFDNDIANFDPMDITGETLGAYDFATERSMHLFFLEPTETLGVVTVTGTVTREGNIEQDGYALPIRVVDGDVKIELFSTASSPAAAVPNIGAPVPETLPRDATFIVDLQREPRAVRVIVWKWDSPTATNSGTAKRDGDAWAWTPDAPLDPGTYVVTFAVISNSGEMSAAAEPFVVE